MGKGDKKTPKGKRFAGSHGNARPRSGRKTAPKAVVKPAGKTAVAKTAVRSAAKPVAKAPAKSATKKAPAKKA
jgi:30S ribosomal protein S31